MPYIPVDKGVQIFFDDINPSGRPVLFIHGWPVNRKMFEYQFNQLPKYGFRCISMDLRGFGQSSKPWEGYSYNTLADDVHCVIDALGLDNAALVGFSMGGAIATRYMARYEGYGISKLALISAAVPKFTQGPNYPYGLPVSEVNNLIHQTYIDRPKMISDFGTKFFASSVSGEFRSWFNGLGLEASGHAVARTAISLRDEDLRRDAQQICVPTAIFAGVQDQIVPFPNAEQMHRYVADSVLIPFKYSGHGLFYDELEKFNHCLTQFLSM
ncbi:alpha/beta hydrolase [Pelosinus sp. IPA-1]|uniref:alpha/beta fold hydrolase n=1 Tax=Pelosinus sp. IPA-1 TaxID=3029569 RepID=UPI002436207A|nr:alpha/beta hydrolase [Pelosinus sp. IPA-1]GMB02255.1 AB hydrolase superfamily protein YisY [Pelosinus sp. IPA-1]